MGLFDKLKYKEPLKVGIKATSEKPYIFACFDKCDAEKVFQELDSFNSLGLNVWYDDGTVKGAEWIEMIVEKIESCSIFIVFISKSSIKSQNVKNQISFAISIDKPIITIYLDDIELQDEIILGKFKKPIKVDVFKPTSEKPFIFASYDNEDFKEVSKELTLLNSLGLNIWYDNDTVKDNDWIEMISEKIGSCSLFLVFISKSSVESQNVRNQILFASSEEKPICAIYLDDTELKHGLESILTNREDNNTELLTEYIKKYGS